MSWLDALGWVGSILLIYSLMQARVLRFRMLNLAACIILVIFNGLLAIWPMVAMNLVLCAINVFFIRRLASERHDTKAFEVLEVGPDDEYLRYMLRVHGEDILKHQPDLLWDAASPSHRAYLVQHGDETVGVVLAERLKDGILQIRLDYVTARFRDFSPGEFVWRRSSILRDEGIRKVVSPPAMLNPYYGRLGFRKESAVYVCDID